MKHEPVLFYREGTCALGSMIALEAIQRPYRLCRLEDQESESETYLGLNPLGEVPTLITRDGNLLTESLAILHHLGAQALEIGIDYRQGSVAFDQLNRVLSYLTSSFHKAFTPLFLGDRFHSDPQIQEEIKDTILLGNLREQLTLVNDYWLHGELLFPQMTIADAYLYGTARWAKNFYDVEKEFPKIHRFLARMESIEAVQLMLAIEAGSQSEARGAFQGHVPLESFASPNDPSLPGLQTSVQREGAEPNRRSGAV